MDQVMEDGHSLVVFEKQIEIEPFDFQPVATPPLVIDLPKVFNRVDLHPLTIAADSAELLVLRIAAKPRVSTVSLGLARLNLLKPNLQWHSIRRGLHLYRLWLI